MNYASPQKIAQLSATEHRLERSLLTKLAALKEKLDNFIAIDRHGNPVGDVRNLVLKQQQLSLVIVQPDVHKHWRFVLLDSHLVERVSLSDRVVFVRTTQADMSYLPDHQPPIYVIGRHNDATTLLAPINQLPAALITDRTHRVEAAKSTTLLSERLATQSAPPLSRSREASPLLDAPATPKVIAPVVDPSHPLAQEQETPVAQAVYRFPKN